MKELWILVFLCLSKGVFADKKPHIIIIVADDLVSQLRMSSTFYILILLIYGGIGSRERKYMHRSSFCNLFHIIFFHF